MTHLILLILLLGMFGHPVRPIGPERTPVAMAHHNAR